MSSKPFFSIVVPLFNKAKFIKNTILSILNQDFKSYEIIIVDDGSTDDGVTIAKTIVDDRIRLIQQVNSGVSSARNRGIREAKADYIAFIDADDLWLPNHLSCILRLIDNYPNSGMYATAYKFRCNGKPDRDIYLYGVNKHQNYSLLDNYFESVANGDLLVWTSCVCIPKNVFFDQNIWFPLGEKFGEDQYVWARIAVSFDVAYCTTPTAIYILETDGNTNAKIENEINPHNTFYMIKNLRPLIADPSILPGFEKYVCKLFFQFPVRNMIFGNKLYAIKQAFGFNLNLKQKIKFIIIFIVPKILLKKVLHFGGWKI